MADLTPDTTVASPDSEDHLPAVAGVRAWPWLAAAVLLVLVTTATFAGEVAASAHEGFLVAVAAVLLVSLAMADRHRQLIRRCEVAEARAETAARCLDAMDHLVASAGAVHGALELHAVLEAILASSLSLLDGRDGSVMLCQGETDLVTVAVSGESGARGARVPVGQGVAGAVAATREPRIVHGVLKAETLVRPPDSSMSIPLVHAGVMVGVLNVNARHGVSFGDDDLDVLQRFGDLAATAIANAQSFENQRLTASRTLYEAAHDPITNLPNRVVFLREVQRRLARSGDRPTALLFLDVDEFKGINDTLGHAAGDATLVAVGRALRRSLPPGSAVARIGGDEFALTFPVDPSRPEISALEFAGTLQEGCVPRPCLVMGHDVWLTLSVGIALGRRGSDTSEDLLRNASIAMHVAKDQRRPVVYDPSMRSRAQERLTLERDLRAALAGGPGLRLDLQPIVRLADGWITGCEALLRWQHPQLGAVPVSEILDIARGRQLMAPLVRWSLETVCRIARHLRTTTPIEPPVIRLNLCPSAMRDVDLFDLVRSSLDDHGVAPDSLMLELTERSLVGNGDTIPSALRDLALSGVGLSLDDFGTGHSSLDTLRRLPVSEIKIDRTFIESLHDGAETAALVRSMVKLADCLALGVVAEGVEHQAELDTLRQIGCPSAQGFLFSNAMAEPEFLDFIARNGSAGTPCIRGGAPFS